MQLLWEVSSYLEIGRLNNVSSCVTGCTGSRERHTTLVQGPPSVVSALSMQGAPSVTLSSPVPGGDPSGKAGVRQLPGRLPEPPCVGLCCNRELPKVTGPPPCGSPAGHYREKDKQMFPSGGHMLKACAQLEGALLIRHLLEQSLLME